MGFRTKLTTIHFKTTSRTNMTPQSTGGLPSTRATLSPSSCLPGDCPLLQTITLQTSSPKIFEVRGNGISVIEQPPHQ